MYIHILREQALLWLVDQNCVKRSVVRAVRMIALLMTVASRLRCVRRASGGREEKVRERDRERERECVCVFVYVTVLLITVASRLRCVGRANDGKGARERERESARERESLCVCV